MGMTTLVALYGMDWPLPSQGWISNGPSRQSSPKVSMQLAYGRSFIRTLFRTSVAKIVYCQILNVNSEGTKAGIGRCDRGR